MIDRRLPSKVILVGQMGAGKSTVAEHLARRLPGFAPCDLDKVIEARGRSVADIFASEGEARFRAIEAEVRDGILRSEVPLVVATGGGAPCQPGAIELMRAAGFVVWLQASPALLVARVGGQGGRPLIAGLQRDEAERFLARQLASREAYYAQAHLAVDASPPPDEVARTIDLGLRNLVDASA